MKLIKTYTEFQKFSKDWMKVSIDRDTQSDTGIIDENCSHISLDTWWGQNIGKDDFYKYFSWRIYLDISKEEYLDEFRKICEPVIKYLNDNYHPHTKIIIDSDSWELVEWLKCVNISNHIKN